MDFISSCAFCRLIGGRHPPYKKYVPQVARAARDGRIANRNGEESGLAVSRIASAMYRYPQDEIIVSTRPGPEATSVAALIPIMAVVLIAFLIIGLALPVLPLHVHQGLALSAFVVGLVTGSQFAASLISRVCSG